MQSLPFLQHSGPIAMAHRGGMAEGVQNTLETFERTVTLGYTYIETDVRATAEGVLYTWHGPSDRERDESPLDLRKLPKKERERLPLFSDVLRAFPHVRFQVDPKHQLAVEPLAREIIAADAMQRVSVGSFSDQRIRGVSDRVFRETGVRIYTAMGPVAIAKLLLRSKLVPFLAWQSAIPGAMPPQKYATKRFVQAAHSGNVHVIPWTVNEKEAMIRLLDMGVDGIITDTPTLLKQVLQERGQWHS